MSSTRTELRPYQSTYGMEGKGRQGGHGRRVEKARGCCSTVSLLASNGNNNHLRLNPRDKRGEYISYGASSIDAPPNEYRASIPLISYPRLPSRETQDEALLAPLAQHSSGYRSTSLPIPINPETTLIISRTDSRFPPSGRDTR